MTSISSYNPLNGPSDSSFKNLLLNTSKPISAGLAIIPLVYGFIAKSALQLGENIPKITLSQAPKSISVIQLASEGIKAAPKIGAAVGSQMIAQNYIESKISNKSTTTNFSSILGSSAITGIISSPFLIAFNDQTIGNSFYKSLRAISPTKVMAVAGRETAFVFSLRFSDPLATKMKEYHNTKTTEKVAYFFSGYIGSIVGHPGDTILTIISKVKKMPSLLLPLNRNNIGKATGVLFRGGNTKAVAVGLFSVFYNTINNSINHFAKK